MSRRIVVFALLLAGLAAAQVPTQPAVTLPTYIMVGGAFNQYATPRINGFVSGITPVSNQAGVYGSVTADLIPIQSTDAKGNKTYLLGMSMRAGAHKIIYNSGNNMLLAGGDLGASFNSSQPATAGIQISPSGSFTLTFIRQINAHFAVGLPIRMLYVSNVGPNGGGAFNPVVQVGVIWKP